MTSKSDPLGEDMTRKVAACVAGWRADPDQPVFCPQCGFEGLCVVDRSVRPYSEWYVVSCAGCALEATLQIPLSPPAP
jgi:hypothetical protein